MTPAQEPRSHGGPTDGLAVHEALARLLSEGRRVGVATVVRARGSHPRAVGAKMLVPDAGAPLFSIGGGPLEASAIADCRAALDGAPSGVHRYDLTEAGDDSVGMTCGGSVEVFIDVEEPPRRLFIFGAGHVGRAVASAAHVAGLLVEVVDDRAEWLDAAALPPGARLHRCAADYASGLPAVPREALAVVMTRCHATDVVVLRSLARARPRHVGFMGSRRKVLRAFAMLREDGVDAAWLETVRAPIGLALGAETPGEIAIAVVAEIVAVLRSPAGAATTAQEAARPLAEARRP
jgi:xanthine dehydrogenase accessory factor